MNIKNHIIAIAFCAVTAMVALGDDGNLLLNADLSLDDGLGFPQGWAFRYEGVGMSKGYSIKPHKDGSFSLKFPKKIYFVQYPLILVSGETYRVSAEVRTTKIGGSGVRIGMWDGHWSRQWWTNPLPSDTKGEWKKVEWTGQLHTPWTNEFTFAIAGAMGDDPETRADIRNLKCEALSPIAKSRSRPIKHDALVKLPARIVPIDPKLAQCPSEGCEMTFYWAGRRQPELGGCRLVAAVDGRELGPVAFGERNRAKVKIGRQKVGAHALKVRVEGPDGAKLAENEYAIRVVAALNGKFKLRKLNNLVSELVNGQLKDGDTEFALPHESWVWISFEGADAARGCLDNCCIPVVRKRDGERRVETMRQLAGGKHVLHVSGAGTGGRLRIHMVKELTTKFYHMDLLPCSQNQRLFVYSLDFEERFRVNSFNCVNPHGWTDTSGIEAGYYMERGYNIRPSVKMGFIDPRRFDVEKCYQGLAGSESWQKGFDICIDENGIRAPRICHVNFGEAVWKMMGERPGQALQVCYLDSPASVFEQEDIETTEIAAIVNSGNGRGLILPEAYSAALSDPQKAYAWERHFASFAQSAIDLVPAARDSIQYYFAAYIDLGSWSDYPCPEADLKAHYAHFVRSIALNPEFDGTIGGLAYGGVWHGEEEIVRWMAKVYRHYAVEGRTDDICEAYGIRYLPGFVKNPDFAEGLGKWIARPAEDGGLVATTIANYGRRVQGRQKVPNGTGDGVAVFTRSAKRPNELSQKLTNLEPGKYYSLLYCTADYDDIAARKGVKPKVAFNADLVGAKEVRDLRFRHCVDGKKSKPVLIVHRHVFKAAADSHVLTFRDWETPTERVGEVGRRRALNYVIFRPYYVENEAEVDELANFFQGR